MQNKKRYSNFHPEKFSDNPATFGFLVDVIMLVLVIVNLSWIVFDWLFSSSFIQSGLFSVFPGFTAFYADRIHADFIFYDLIFVAIYLSEFLVRWCIAIARSTYHRWFFYPFVHWYDLLGCIPVGSFRWLRILRIISILLRLQRMGVLDLRETALGQFVMKYYRIVLEEVSDRVVINVLDGVQREVLEGNPLLHRVESNVLAPRKQELLHLLVVRLQSASEMGWKNNRQDLYVYLEALSQKVIRSSSAGASLASVPIVGNRIIERLDHQLADLLLDIVDQVIQDLSSPESRESLEASFHSVIDSFSTDSEGVNDFLKHFLVDLLEEVKQQVAMQQWKVAEESVAKKFQ